jgi:hypothetical protein
LVTGLTGLLLGCTLGGARAYGWLLVASHLALLAFDAVVRQSGDSAELLQFQ